MHSGFRGIGANIMVIAMSVIVTLIVLTSSTEGFSSTHQGVAVLPTRGMWNNKNKQQQHWQHTFAIHPVPMKSSPLRMSDTTAASAEDVDESSTEPTTTAVVSTSATTSGFWNKVKAIVPPANERQKLIPLALMFFCILFSYTILRDTKDVLMITAPKSGAEVIPFIKTYVNLPVAIVRI
jgi:hypothetical protein